MGPLPFSISPRYQKSKNRDRSFILHPVLFSGLSSFFVPVYVEPRQEQQQRDQPRDENQYPANGTGHFTDMDRVELRCHSVAVGVRPKIAHHRNTALGIEFHFFGPSKPSSYGPFPDISKPIMVRSILGKVDGP